jgi:hypothetical protein
VGDNLPPFLGPMRPWGERTCFHSPHGGTFDELCGAEGAWHIMWTQTGESSVCCEHHRHECKLVRHAVQVHKLLPDCTMPGAMWYKEEGVCRWEPPMTDEPEPRLREAAFASV